MTLDISEFFMAKTVDIIQAGKAYKFTIPSGEKSFSKIFYCLKADYANDEFIMVHNNPWDDKGDSVDRIHKKSTRKNKDGSTFEGPTVYSVDGKSIEELNTTETKAFVKTLKSWEIRQKFGLPPATRMFHGKKIEIK